jgi:uncharacterized protein
MTIDNKLKKYKPSLFGKIIAGTYIVANLLVGLTGQATARQVPMESANVLNGSSNIPIVRIFSEENKNNHGAVRHCNKYSHLPDVVLVSQYSSGQEAFKLHCLNGKPEGRQISWHENGRKSLEEIFVNGKLNGKQTEWYSNGRKRLERNFVSGIREGREILWRESGQKWRDRNFVSGELEDKVNDIYLEPQANPKIPIIEISTYEARRSPEDNCEKHSNLLEVILIPDFDNGGERFRLHCVRGRLKVPIIEVSVNETRKDQNSNCEKYSNLPEVILVSHNNRGDETYKLHCLSGRPEIPEIEGTDCNLYSHIPEVILLTDHYEYRERIKLRCLNGEMEIPVIEKRAGDIEYNAVSYCRDYSDIKRVIFEDRRSSRSISTTLRCLNGKPLGRLVGTYENGRKAWEHNFVNGRKEGIHRRWYENGQKELEVPFVNGIMSGKRTNWCNNGQKCGEVTYVNGEKHGIEIRWHSDGQKWSERNFVNGKRE